MPGWHLYMIRCGDGSLYTGIATDVKRRFAAHASGTGARYLRGRGPLEVVLSLPVGGRSEALRLEQRVKRLPKRQKELLVDARLTLDDIQPG
jgi:putative endonuclease